MNKYDMKEVMKEALREWVTEVEFLHTHETNEGGSYYCSRANCEGVRFPSKPN